MTLHEPLALFHLRPETEMSYARADAISIDTKYQETVYEHGRLFQKFSIDNRIYCVPVDDVRLPGTTRLVL